MLDGGSLISFSNGAYSWTPAESRDSIQYLVVAGGGGGSSGVNNVYWQAGAGAGAVLSGSSAITAGNTYSITVGAGGVAQTAGSTAAGAINAPNLNPLHNGGRGGSSTFDSVTANGGFGSVANRAIGSASGNGNAGGVGCLLYTSPSPRDRG